MIYLIYCLFAYLDGLGDGILYSRKGAQALPGNEHRYLVHRRVAAWLMGVGGFVYGWLFGLSGALLLTADSIALVLAFSFWHNGAYNLMRDKIGNTVNGWRYTSPTDTSEWNFDYSQRRGMLYASIAILIISYLLYFFVL